MSKLPKYLTAEEIGDILEFSDDDSASESEIEDQNFDEVVESESTSENESLRFGDNDFVSKDNIVWSPTPPSSGRTTSRNLISLSPGILG